VLIRHLPPESATKTALRNAMDDIETKQMAETADPSKGQWSQTEMLLALLIDTVRQLNHTTIRLQHGKKAGKGPDPIPRPGVKPKTPRRKTLTSAQRELLFRRIRGEDLHATIVGVEAQPAIVRRERVPSNGAPHHSA
jgi:hypothetical protein